MWTGLPPIERPALPAAQNNRLTGKTSWASLRAVEYQSRPNHADQLQVELWWQGVNLLCDSGTYRYNAPAPWDNRLVSAFYHNAITVDEQEPMTRAGRFLWLDWDQSKTLAEFTSSSCITAERYGYRKLGILHRRSLEWMGEDDWQVVDDLLPTRPTDQPRQIKLQWLLPDYEYILSPDRLTLCLPSGKFSLLVQSRIQPMKSTLVRAGEVLQGSGPADPCAGWVSPTYSKRSPALSWQLEWRVSLPIQIVTRFHLEAQEK
jgi:hypothetical protein